MALIYPGGAGITTVDNTDLESNDMTLIGSSIAGAAQQTDYSDIKAGILANVIEIGDTLSGDVTATLASGATSCQVTDLTIASEAAGDILYFNGSNWIRLAKGTAAQVLKMNSGATAPAWNPLFDYVRVSDTKAANTAGGGFTQGAWRTRDITSEDSDTSSICSISSNQITLAAGTYIALISAPAYAVDRHHAQLYDTTGTAVLLNGTSEHTSSGDAVQNRSIVSGKFTLSVQSVLEVQHYCQTTAASNGFGIESNFSVSEVYTIAEFWRITN